MSDSIIGLQPDATGNGANQADLIKDSDQQNFIADVIEASKQTPVLVDFWAPWCGPCKQLTPVLEKAVTSAGGAVKLVKINVDENQAIAQQMRVQSIPAVFAFADGKPVDGFMGAKPEGEIKAFIDKLAASVPGSPNEQITQALEQADQALISGDIQTAGQIYAAIVQADNENLDALLGMARCQIETGDLEAANATLALVPPSSANDARVLSIKARLELAANPVDESEVLNLTEAVNKNPEDFESRFALATALNNAGERQEALDQLFYILKKNRGWNDEAARKQVLTFFEAWGPASEDTASGRRQLSAILFS